MIRAEKETVVKEVTDIFEKAKGIFVTDFQGLNVEKMGELRRKCREVSVGYVVVKNTLARFAAQRAGRDNLVSFFEGPIAIAFGSGEITDLAKLISDYIRTSKSTLIIRGGFWGDERFTSEEVMTLSTLPSREVLLAKALGSMQSPILGLLNCLTAPMREIAGILQARIQQLEGE